MMTRSNFPKQMDPKMKRPPAANSAGSTKPSKTKAQKPRDIRRGC